MSDKKEVDNPDVKVRSLVLQTPVWDALDDDARKCRRSSVKQLEAILVAYYRLGNIELDYEQLEEARRIVGPQPQGGKVEVIGLEHEPEDRVKAKESPQKQSPVRIVGRGYISQEGLEAANRKKLELENKTALAEKEKSGKKK